MTGGRWQQWLGVGGVYLFVVALLLAGRAISADFWARDNLLQTVQDVSILGIVASGLAFITYSGHFVDLSIPVQMAVAGIVAAFLLPSGLWIALLAGLVAGTLLGLLNGLVVGYLRLNPILWTLAALALVDGITRWAYGSTWKYADETTAAGQAFVGLYRARVLGVPLTVVVFAGVALAGWFLLRHTGFGRRLKLVGAACEAARTSGVPVARTVALAFALSGCTAALGGLLKTSLNKYGDVEIGLGYDFQAITAVVIGGMPLAGGRGSMVGVVGGVLVIGLLGRILPLVPGVTQDHQLMVRGLLFVVVVGWSQWLLRRGGRDDQ
jgi:ribose/xylose/arabinose/galactoside ABC-type transport system permease subunit